MSTVCHNLTSEQNCGKTSIVVARLPHSVKVSGVKASGGLEGLDNKHFVVCGLP